MDQINFLEKQSSNKPLRRMNFSQLLSQHSLKLIPINKYTKNKKDKSPPSPRYGPVLTSQQITPLYSMANNVLENDTPKRKPHKHSHLKNDLEKLEKLDEPIQNSQTNLTQRTSFNKEQFIHKRNNPLIENKQNQQSQSFDYSSLKNPYLFNKQKEIPKSSKKNHQLQTNLKENEQIEVKFYDHNNRLENINSMIDSNENYFSSQFPINSRNVSMQTPTWNSQKWSPSFLAKPYVYFDIGTQTNESSFPIDLRYHFIEIDINEEIRNQMHTKSLHKHHHHHQPNLFINQDSTNIKKKSRRRSSNLKSYNINKQFDNSQRELEISYAYPRFKQKQQFGNEFRSATPDVGTIHHSRRQISPRFTQKRFPESPTRKIYDEDLQNELETYSLADNHFSRKFQFENEKNPRNQFLSRFDSKVSDRPSDPLAKGFDREEFMTLSETQRHQSTNRNVENLPEKLNFETKPNSKILFNQQEKKINPNILDRQEKLDYSQNKPSFNPTKYSEKHLPKARYSRQHDRWIGVSDQIVSRMKGPDPSKRSEISSTRSQSTAFSSTFSQKSFSDV
ncbi:hypothetical protein M0811_00553 [Anaeramoeba ignava]|uniref:Uncharacterized protein n=1 Tax=Anaeramoeba ignava TaxID=1746090 RepID=A0A9Q0RF22_ANAIG|nr:hypothetical protein M0811_00553 [Anaeramoeba ignava]